MAKLGQQFDGVVVHVGTLPGGTMAPYNKGYTMVHEVGGGCQICRKKDPRVANLALSKIAAGSRSHQHMHRVECLFDKKAKPYLSVLMLLLLPLLHLPILHTWLVLSPQVGHWLGLLHVFENGCSNIGDSVEDTAPQATAAYGCPLQRKTCPGPAKDPVTNYMGYTDDACMNGFTRGQAGRILSMWGVYRGSVGVSSSGGSASGTKPEDIIYEAAPRPPPIAAAPTPPVNPPVSTEGSGIGMQLPVLFRALTNRANIGGSSSNKGNLTPILPAAVPLGGESAGQYSATFESFEAPAPADPAAAFAAAQAAAGVALQQQPYLQPMVASAALLSPASGSSSGAAYYSPTVAAAFAAHQQQASAAAAQQQQQQQQLWQQPSQQQQQQYAYSTWVATPPAANMYPASKSAAAAAAVPAALEASQIWSSSATGSIFNTQEDNSHSMPGSSSSSLYSTGSFSGGSSNMYNVPRIPIPAASAAQYIQAKPIAAAGLSYNLASLLSTMAGGYNAGSPPARLSSDQAGVAAAAAPAPAAAVAVPDVMQAAGIVPKPRAAASRLSSGRRKML
jgi:type II secretory pathway pseudopilin PulG